MEWDVQLDEDFEAWLLGVEARVRNEIASHIDLLRQFGPHLGRPHVDTVEGSAYPNVKELRVRFRVEPWRILFAFDPTRRAILLVGGHKGATVAGTKPTSRSPTNGFGGTWNAWNNEAEMAIPLEDFLAKLPEEDRQAIAKRSAELIAEEATLRQVREARSRSQEAVARKLNIQQAAVSKLERRTDMYLSTLRGYIEAMGGTLEIVAHFPDQSVRITQFQALDPETSTQD